MIAKKAVFKSKDAAGIYYGAYFPDSRLKAVVLFFHGIYESFEVYENLAGRLTRHGIGLISFDYRGFGKSAGTRGFIQASEDWMMDIDMLIGIVRQDIPGDVALFFLAYSMGSVIGLEYLLKRKPRVDGVVLAGTGYTFSPAILYLCKLAGVINRLFPQSYVLTPARTGVIRSQKLYFSSASKKSKKRLYPSIGAELLKCLRDIQRHLGSLDIPVYLQYSRKDFFFRGRGKLFDSIRSGDKSFTVYHDCKHDIYKEVIRIRRKVFTDLIEWLGQRV